MAFASEIHNFESGIVCRMRATLGQARAHYNKRRVFKATYAELNRLTERDLDDLGIARANIGEIARAAAYEK